VLLFETVQVGLELGGIELEQMEGLLPGEAVPQPDGAVAEERDLPSAHRAPAVEPQELDGAQGAIASLALRARRSQRKEKGGAEQADHEGREATAPVLAGGDRAGSHRRDQVAEGVHVRQLAAPRRSCQIPKRVLAVVFVLPRRRGDTWRMGP